MRGQRAAPDITGNENNVKSFETQDISLFHYTDLSEKVENYNGIQQSHNIVKYCILAGISGIILLVVMYKCVNFKKQKMRRRRIAEALEMTSLHNNVLMEKGIVPKRYKKKEQQKEKKGRKEKRKWESESEEEEEDKEQKDRMEGKGIEAEDGWKQKQQPKDKAVEEDWKQKQQSVGKAEEEGETGDRNQKRKTRRKWRWVEESESE